MKGALHKYFAVALLFLAVSCSHPRIPYGETARITQEQMMDRILGGWYGQAIGCAFGGPTEFRYPGAFIPDNVPLFRDYDGDPSTMPGRIHSRWRVPVVWYDGILADNMVEDPGIYDDVYMDMAFVEVMAEHGIDAPIELFADRFAHAEFPLWCANQNARYNILQGVDPLEAGYWKNSPHADDIDFQIEADFSGLLSPAMPVRSAQIGDNIGHMLNYGDGWYGGVFVGAMYSLAFVCDDMPTIVAEAAKMIPEGTKFRNCINDVLLWWKQYPDDWHQCWLKVAENHTSDIGNFDGIFNGRDISAVVNSAYVAIGLLYGAGDFIKTMEIATRCGQDSDCNPATAVGILATAKGFSAMPQEWKDAAKCIENTPFPYSEWSLAQLAGVNARLIAENLSLCEGGSFNDGIYEIKVQRPEPVRYEQSFEGLVPLEKCYIREWGAFSDSLNLEFEGNSVVVAGNLTGKADESYVAEIDAWLDGVLVEKIKMPYAVNARKTEIFWKFGFNSGKHKLHFVWKNPVPGLKVRATGLIAYDRIVGVETDKHASTQPSTFLSKVSVYSGATLVQEDIFERDSNGRLSSFKRRDVLSGEDLFNEKWTSPFDVTTSCQDGLIEKNAFHYEFDDAAFYSSDTDCYENYIPDGKGNIAAVHIGSKVHTDARGQMGSGAVTEVNSEKEVVYEYCYSDRDDLQNFNAYLFNCNFPQWMARGFPGCRKLVSGMTLRRGSTPLRQSFKVDYTSFDADGRLLEAVRTDFVGDKQVCSRTYRLSYEKQLI